MMMRVKALIISKAAGSRARPLSRISVWIFSDQDSPPSGSGWLVRPLSTSACAAWLVSRHADNAIRSPVSSSPVFNPLALMPGDNLTSPVMSEAPRHLSCLR